MTTRSRIALVGAGPRGTSLLERLVANSAECLPDTALTVHVIDPFPPGGGRVWRDQSPSLWSNTPAGDCTLFTDDTVACAGPVEPGPTLAEWAAAITARRCPLPEGFAAGPDVLDEAARTHRGWFPTRSLVGAYLSWVFWRTAARGRPNVDVVVHRAVAVDTLELPGGGQRVVLSDGGTLDVDVVVHAQGNSDVAPTPDQADLADLAARRSLVYVPSKAVTESVPDTVPAGEPVLLRGLGLSAVDTILMVTEGRGGRFRRNRDGVLRYLPSGREPLLYAGSRRGLPYRARPAHQPAQLPEPRYLRPGAVAPGPVDFSVDLWPLIARDLTEAGLRALAAARPERFAVDPGPFLSALTELEWGTPAYRRLVMRAVPDPGDRFDVADMDHLLTGRRFAGLDAVTRWVDGYLAEEVAGDRRDSSATALYYHVRALADALLAGFGHRDLAAGSPPHSLADFLEFCRFRTSGPPSYRLEQLRALIDAGLLRLIGEGMAVEVGADAFVARSTSHGQAVTARVLVEGRLAGRSVTRGTDPLVRALTGRGELREAVHTDPVTGVRMPTGLPETEGARHRRPDGTAHPARLVAYPGNFPRPRAGALFLRQSDYIARETLAGVRSTVVTLVDSVRRG
ncbi:MAG: FAD/NAD(P)-binding protein [Saccharothrix sp.]|nr:FAD/NAD(P)-binding protein [Saccharothrix sp.]